MTRQHSVDGKIEGDINLFQIGAVPLRQWRTVVAIAAGIVLVVVIYSLIVPKAYTARTTLVPIPGESDVAGRLASLAGDLPLGLGGLVNDRNPPVTLVTILESRSVADSIIARFDLGSLWDLERIQDARDELADRTSITQDREDGHIVIAYSDPDPTRAARIANAYPEILNAVNARIGGEAALRKSEFLERQLAYARQELEEAEQHMVEFQRGTRSPEIEEQARQTVLAAAELQARIFEKEAEVAQLRRVSTSENPKLRAAASELSTLREQLSRITGGRAGSDGSDVLLSFSEAPELGVTYARLLREYAKQEQIYVALTAGLAESRIDAGNDVPIIAVLDPAVEPEIRSRPARRRMTLFAGVAGLVLGLVMAFVVEWIDRGGEREENREFYAAWRQLRADVGRFLSRPRE